MKVVAEDSLDLAKWIRRGDSVLWGQTAAEPSTLTTSLMAQRHRIGQFDVFIGATWSETADPLFADVVRFRSYCAAGANRRLAKAGVLDILPCNYSHLATLIRSGRLKVDAVMLQLAPADANGHYSLAGAYEYMIPAIAAARVVIAEINDQAPWTFGERTVTAADIDVAILTSRPPLSLPPAVPSQIERAVARHAAALIEDGATLQFGIGTLPEAVLAELSDRRDLGIHSGALVDEAARLAQAGVITNARKSIDPGIAIAGVIMGGPTTCDYANQNPAVQFRSVDYTHSLPILAAIKRFVAINSAIEVDLTGQVNAEVAAGHYVGAVGGAGDFLRGAHCSDGGVPIVVLPSFASSGGKRVSRIVAKLNGPVSTARSDAGFIVTEHGVADLRGLSLSQRVACMLAIADPEFRDGLERASAQFS